MWKGHSRLSRQLHSQWSERYYTAYPTLSGRFPLGLLIFLGQEKVCLSVLDTILRHKTTPIIINIIRSLRQQNHCPSFFDNEASKQAKIQQNRHVATNDD